MLASKIIPVKFDTGGSFVIFCRLLAVVSGFSISGTTPEEARAMREEAGEGEDGSWTGSNAHHASLDVIPLKIMPE